MTDVINETGRPFSP